ncbi:MAG TPA: DUF1349 domain-containing protein [Planctomycetota bacterium]|nr:DUF1349 domain-containing protein [Planctomycetota bacterium]
MKAAATLVLALLLQDPPLFEEKFAGGKLGDGWTWLREDSGGWKLEGASLKMKALPGTIWYKKNDAKNLLLRKAPAPGTEAAPIAIEVTVDSVPETNAEQCGLFLYYDDSNYIKLIRECNKGKPGIVIAREQKGIPESLPPKEEIKGPVTLKLVWAGAKVTGFYKAAADWVTLGDYELPESAAELRIGLGAHGAPADANRWATFSAFKISKAAK